MTVEFCPICYLPAIKQCIIKDICGNNLQNCQACATCVSGHIVSQFGKRTTDFNCLCSQTNKISEDKIKQFMQKDQYMKLERYRLSRQVDSNVNMLWCVNIKCDAAITRIGNARQVVCLKCNTNACFRCQRPWHGDNICDDANAVGFGAYLCRKDVRKCP